MGQYGRVREGMGGYGTVWGDLGAFEGGTEWYGTGFPRKFLNRPVASTSLVKQKKAFAIILYFVRRKGKKREVETCKRLTVSSADAGTEKKIVNDVHLVHTPTFMGSVPNLLRITHTLSNTHLILSTYIGIMRTTLGFFFWNFDFVSSSQRRFVRG